VVDELIDTDPFAVFEPFLELREICVFCVFCRDYYAGVLVVLVVTVFLADVVEAQHLVEQLHYGEDVIVRGFKP
jgi:hypothetical protein